MMPTRLYFFKGILVLDFFIHKLVSFSSHCEIFAFDLLFKAFERIVHFRVKIRLVMTHNALTNTHYTTDNNILLQQADVFNTWITRSLQDYVLYLIKPERAYTLRTRTLVKFFSVFFS